MKILHLINDHQVIERTLGVYEELFPQQNDVIIFNSTDKYKHLNKYSSFTLVTSDNIETIAKRYDFSCITHVIAHYMTMDKIDFIKYIPKNIHVCWEVYGYDLYNQFLEPNGYKISYTPSSKYKKYAFARTYFPSLFNIALYVRGYRNVLKWEKNRKFRYICNRINSIQYCCKYDALFIEKYAKRTIPSYEVFNYSLSEVLGDLKDSRFASGKYIMVGNSASFSNNHFYILNYLEKLGLPSDFKIIMPLSYGGTQKYADDVEKRFKDAFPGKVDVLRQYIPLQEYNNLFLNINSCIMSSWRQESIGTIILCLYLGIKVFMSQKSPLYQWLKDCGFIIFELESASCNSLQNSLDDDSRILNRKLINKRYNEDQVAKTLKCNIS